MKQILTYIILMVCVLQMKTSEAGAQALGESQMLSSSVYKEKLYLFADRNLFASGEKVSFRLYNLSHPLLKENRWSRACYLELINSRNEAVARGKYQVYTWGAAGQITIPDTASTGPYYLRAYTRWMRNYPPSEYFHLPLAIVNPRKISSEDLSAGAKGTGSGGEAPGPVAGIACSPDKNSYGKREKVSVQIHPESRDSSPDAYCISVIKKGYLDEAYRYTTVPASEDALELKDLDHFPETRGVSLSGIVRIGEENKPAARTLLGMTMLGSDPDYFECITDENGRFRIAVQQQTEHNDALVTIHPNRDEAVKILIDEAYSSDFSTAPVPAADFFGERRALVEDAMVNAQLRSAFEVTDKEIVDAAEPHPDHPFYGTPEFRYRMDDYVVLPNLEEFFFEIVLQVQVEKNEDHANLVVLDDRGEILYAPPLILLDHVPVQEIGKLLPLSPLLFDHIDIVNKMYLRGNLTYGGIVSIITAQGDRAGVALPGGSAFLSFTGLSELQETESPVYEGVAQNAGVAQNTGVAQNRGVAQNGRAVRNERMPDLRTTLYWAPRYEITPDNGGSFAFYTSDVTGEFMVVVRGMTSEGNVLSGTCEFIVK